MTPLSITLSTGRSLREKAWQRVTMSWDDFKTKCSSPKRTPETYETYLAMNRDSQSDIKDVGGFVAAVLTGPRRKASMVAARTAVTIDIDDTEGRTADDVWEEARSALPNVAMLCYSTHKHSNEAPRLRIVVPFTRSVSLDIYNAAARMAAKVMGVLDIVDPTTFDVERLFFWPSVAKDGDFFFRAQDGQGLDTVEILAHYAREGKLWTDKDSWPQPKKKGTAEDAAPERPKRDSNGDKLSDPLAKPGIVGAFCRAYSPIDKGIDELLPDVYTRGQHGRYTYVYGTTSNGLALYGLDEADPVMRFAMSRHSTDPACNQCCNIWDLVRIHKFGDLDEGAKGTGTDLPSYKAMAEFAASDRKTTELTLAEKLKAFDHVDMQDDETEGSDQPKPKPKKQAPTGEWTSQLKKRKVKGVATDEVLPSADNLLRIFDNDPNLKGLIGYNQLRECIEKRRVPFWGGSVGYWSDRDDASLRIYIEQVYGISAKEKIQDVLSQTADKHGFHPIRDYLNALPKWDPETSTARLDTLFIDALGAEDTPLNRAISRKAIVAAVARVMQPGCKFDYCLTLVGPEGIGKSTIFRILAGDEFYNDSISTFDGKDALEQLQGAWIVEIAELSACSRSDIARTKQVLTVQEDKFRKAYGRRTESYKRQCIIVGTSNEDTPLRGETGNRRFWLLYVGKERRRIKLKDLKAMRDEIWAEALYRYRQGEVLYLDNEAEAEEMQQRQREGNAALSDDPIAALLELFLDMHIPENWADMDMYQRRDFVKGNATNTFALRPRVVFSACEFICEALCKDLSDLNYKTYSKRVSQLMKDHPEWEYHGANTSRHCQKLYGRQRFWVRLQDSNDSDL